MGLKQPFETLEPDGTNGIGWTIHTAVVDDDGGLENYREWKNVVDIVNLPNGSVKFNYEDGEKHLYDARIVRAKVRGLNEAIRYRCSECENDSSDVVAAEPRGVSTSIHCPLCEQETEFEAREIADI
jgi:hypothetical protein